MGFPGMAAAAQKIKESGGVCKGCQARLYFLQWMCCRKFLLTGYYDCLNVRMTSCLENGSNYELFINILSYLVTACSSAEHLIWSLFFKNRDIALRMGVWYHILWKNVHHIFFLNSGFQILPGLDFNMFDINIKIVLGFSMPFKE